MTANLVVGFIGAGLMGWGMAKNVVEKGFDLRVMAHRKREAIDDLVGRGAVEVANPKEMAEQCDVIVLCVTGAPQVMQVLEGESGILEGAREGLTIVDTSTSEPDQTERLHKELAARGIVLVDAPLSRTPAHAWDGELTTYVGGDEATIERLRPLLSTWATAIIPTGGPVGSAHAAKLINNVVAIGFASIWAECYTMVRKVGLEPQVFREILTNSGMNCGNFQSYSKYICEGDPNAHKFTLRNCLKDITYYNRLATRNNAATLMSDGALQAMKLSLNLGYGDRFMPELVDVFAALSDLEPSPDTKA